MHEMSLAGGILQVVEDAAAREPFRRVSRLSLEAGALSGVEVGALRFAREAIAPGTLLEGAIIDIGEPAAPGLVHALQPERVDPVAHGCRSALWRPAVDADGRRRT